MVQNIKVLLLMALERARQRLNCAMVLNIKENSKII
jgi:hypothetical protein